MPILFRHMIYRKQLKDNPNILYVFGDNMVRQGYGGQAREMRGEPNAVGIPTKWRPDNTDGAFFYDYQLPQIKKTLIQDLIF